MDIERARVFLREKHQAVMATYNRDGSVQMSPVTVGLGDDGRPEISTRETAVKVRNLRRDPRVSLCLITPQFYGEWLYVDGRAEILELPDALEPLVDYYRRISGEHPDWDDYRAAMVRDRRVLLQITITRVGPDFQG